MLERTDHWQAGLVFPKGEYQELREKGVEAVRQTITEIEPRYARHVPRSRAMRLRRSVRRVTPSGTRRWQQKTT